MNTLVKLHNSIFGAIERATDGWLTPTLARLIFAGTLLVYYWGSALTKLGDGIFGFVIPSTGAYIQIFPKAVEAAGYDISQLGFFHWVVVMAGTYAEFLLPILIIIGLFTRLAAIGMIGFVIVQSWVDVVGHNLAAKDVGAWFDRDPSSLIIDQRSFWIFLLLILVIKGAGPIAADRFVLAPKEDQA